MVLVAWLSKWRPGAKAVLLTGPPGTGKTTVVTLLAREMGMNLVELNASDTRTKTKLQTKIGEAMNTVSLFGETSLIFLDEVDGLAGRSDYGAVEFIKDSIKESKNPLAMAANDSDSDEVKKLAGSCVVVPFRPPPPRQVEAFLRGIARAEGLGVSDESLRRCVVEGGGDIRHAINSLQSAAQTGEEGRKDTTLTLSAAMNKFFEARDRSEALAALRKVPLQPFEKIREIHRSVVRSDLPPEKMARALEAISRADLLMAKIQRTSDWRLLRYLDALLAGDLQTVARGGGVRYSQEDLPFPVLLRVWNDSKKVKELSLRYAAHAHTSARSARSEDLPYLFRIASSKRFREELERVLDLDETYDKFLQKEAGRRAG